MVKVAVTDPAVALKYLESVPVARSELAEREFKGLEALESAEARESALPTPPEYSGGVDQVVTVGSQIAEFAANVPADLRPHISNSFLLAQLAANYEIRNNGGGTREWYDKYVEVLAHIGWIVEDDADAKKEVIGTSVEVHKEIIGFLTVALGPAAAGAAIVLAALKGLQNMAKDQPWITIFERESQRATVDQFQVSYVDAGENKQPRVTIGGFELNASVSLTQFLFFKVKTAEATLVHYTTKLAINDTVFEASSKVVSDRIANYVTGYVSEIKI